MSRPLTPSQLRAWLKYYATKGAYCPAGCGKKFADDEQWAWLVADRLYFIDRDCALVWAGGRNVIEPADVPALLASAQWERAGSGLVGIQGPTLAPKQRQGGDTMSLSPVATPAATRFLQ